MNWQTKKMEAWKLHQHYIKGTLPKAEAGMTVIFDGDCRITPE